MKVKRRVLVISGSNSGVVSELLKVYPAKGKALVKGVNLGTKHIKKGQSGPGRIIKFERLIDISNLRYFIE